jgi:hypothetical protein
MLCPLSATPPPREPALSADFSRIQQQLIFQSVSVRSLAPLLLLSLLEACQRHLVRRELASALAVFRFARIGV